MEAKKPTMKNIKNYLTEFMTKRCHDLFKDFLPPNYVPLVQKNSIGDSEFTSPCATQIFNMCNKKQNWQYSSIEQVAEAIIKDLKDEDGIISEFKMVVQESPKKDDKKEKKKKSKFQKISILIFILALPGLKLKHKIFYKMELP